MSNQSFTPGPWAASSPYGPLNHYYIMVGNQTIIAKLPSPNIWGENVVNGLVDNDLLIGNDRERLANAHLIAAAPELLAALRECEHELSGREDIDGNGNPNSAARLVPVIEAAIAKATGEPSPAESIDIVRHL